MQSLWVLKILHLVWSHCRFSWSAMVTGFGTLCWWRCGPLWCWYKEGTLWWSVMIHVVHYDVVVIIYVVHYGDVMFLYGSWRLLILLLLLLLFLCILLAPHVKFPMYMRAIKLSFIMYRVRSINVLSQFRTWNCIVLYSHGPPCFLQWTWMQEGPSEV